MRKFFFKIFLWVYIKIHTVFINLGLAMQDEAMSNFNIDERGKRTTRKIHPNKLLEKFYAGQRDEKYVQDYYELLKKADKFMRNATPHQKAAAADRWGMNVGIKDKYGRRYDHVGFFDDKHKHAGKTIKEVLEAELLERRTNDDDYELLAIINNDPIETGLSKVEEVVDDELLVNDMLNKSKTLEFPIKVTRETEVVNKIEQLAEFMHIKKIGFEHRQLEFFIPLKFKTTGVTEGSKIFTELINVGHVYVNDEYGDVAGFNVHSFEKRIIYDDTHEVWKFHGIEMQTIKQY